MISYDPWPKEKRLANFKAVEQDLFTYKLMKKQIKAILEEIDEMAAPQAVGNYDLYLTETANHKISEIPANYIAEYTHGTKQRRFSDPTPEKAEKIMEYKQKLLSGLELREMIRHVEAIEFVLGRLARSGQADGGLKLVLIEEKYFKRELTDQGIVQKLNISLRTFYYWKKEIIREIGTRLGVIV